MLQALVLHWRRWSEMGPDCLPGFENRSHDDFHCSATDQLTQNPPKMVNKWLRRLARWGHSTTISLTHSPVIMQPLLAIPRVLGEWNGPMSHGMDPRDPRSLDLTDSSHPSFATRPPNPFMAEIMSQQQTSVRNRAAACEAAWSPWRDPKQKLCTKKSACGVQLAKADLGLIDCCPALLLAKEQQDTHVIG